MDTIEAFNSKKLAVNVKHGKEISLIGIQRQKNGRYGAQIRDGIRHKKVWLGTFDTVEEASQAYFNKKSEFENEKLTNKESKRIRVENKKGKYNFDNASQAYQSKRRESNAMQQQCTNKHTHSEQAGGSQIDVLITTDRRIDSHGISTAEERFRVNQCNEKQVFEDLKSCLMANVRGTKSSDQCDGTTSCNPKARRSLIGIRRRKSGRYQVVITDRIRHKSVYLGTFDTIEEASQAYLSKKCEFEKLRQQRNKENKPKKNCDQIQQPESPVVVASVDTADSASVRDKRIGSHKTTPHIGAYNSKTAGRYMSEITNPITKKEIWLGTFDTAEEASQAYQSNKKLEFQKLVNAKHQHCTQRKSEILVNVKQGRETVNCEPFQPKSAGGSPDIDVPFSNSLNGGTVQSIDSDKIGTAQEAFPACQCKKFDLQSSKKAELQSNMRTDSSAGKKQEGPDDGDLWMGEWVQLQDNTAVMFSLRLGLPIIDNYGYLLGEFSSLDDLSVCITEDDNQT